MFHIYYRISDKGHRENKPAYITIRNCLEQFLTRFERTHVTLFADNCYPETLDWLHSLGIPRIVETSLGNARGCEYVWRHACEHLAPDDWVYFVEDDYVHCADARRVLEDAMRGKEAHRFPAHLRYFTLYDHPGHYFQPYGLYPCTVHRIDSGAHWRTADSTTMTFACQVKDLAEDLAIFSEYTKGPGIPNDYYMFQTCNRARGGHVVACPIPGRSTHGQFGCLGSCAEFASDAPDRAWARYFPE